MKLCPVCEGRIRVGIPHICNKPEREPAVIRVAPWPAQAPREVHLLVETGLVEGTLSVRMGTAAQVDQLIADLSKWRAEVFK
ncbi:MAG: hypothetical protein E6R03_16980 [Hyphomicrobiaceae bacterium]|nr:MAG: hypothetical protein E6R03_16980 [Hyphomicrobiaceae bacterium]